MKFKDLKVGMMVAIGTREQVINGEAEKGVVLEVGGWNDQQANGGYIPLFTTKERPRFYRGGGKGVALAVPSETLRVHYNGKAAKRPKWYPNVVGANRIACTWEEALEIHNKAEAHEQKCQAENKARQNTAREVATMLARMGVQFGYLEYRGSITLDLEQMRRLQAILTDLMPGSMQATLPKMVVHCEGFGFREALCGEKAVGKIGQVAVGKVVTSAMQVEQVTCPECLTRLAQKGVA